MTKQLDLYDGSLIAWISAVVGRPVVLVADEDDACVVPVSRVSGMPVTDQSNYSRLSNGKLAHRVVAEATAGDITGFEVHHRCGVRSCVNPKHLQTVKRVRHLWLHQEIRRNIENEKRKAELRRKQSWLRGERDRL